ncbi:MAG: conjugal transfer protein TrbL family protein [Candidatus Woykebacteria bacterium]
MKVLTIISAVALFLASTKSAFAASNNEVANFTNQTLTVLIIFASLACTFFLIKGGYAYITSTGKPDSLEHAKNTIRNALLGFVLVLAAGVISSLLNNAFITPSTSTATGGLSLTPIVPSTPSNGLTQILLDAISGFLSSIVQSATKPLTDGIISFLTTTPSLVANSVIFNFWLVIVGIVDSLFALVVALLGFQIMSASTFGFDEIEFKNLLPKLGLAFLLANTSIFLADWVVQMCNVLVSAVLHATGGINSAFITNSFDPTSLATGTTPLIMLIFMVLFVIIAVVLLLFYVSRLIIIALGAVLAPLIFLLWAVPKFTDFAEIAIKTYIITIFTVFVHVVIIQLASAFLTVPGQVGTNSLISILIGIGLLFTLLKTPSVMMQLAFFTAGNGMVRKVGGQIINVISTDKSGSAAAVETSTPMRTPRKVVKA